MSSRTLTRRWEALKRRKPLRSVLRKVKGTAIPLERSSDLLTLLPTELQLQILHFVDIGDILALRQTCRTLEALTRMQDVWLTATHNLVSTFGVLQKSYDFATMSSNALELLVLRAVCFPKALLRPDKSILSRRHAELQPPQLPTIDRSISNETGGSANTMHAVTCHSSNARFNSSLLVPGGRYLFTSVSTSSPLDLGPQSIHLWDLESQSLENGMSSVPLMSSDFCVEELRLHKAFPTTCGRGIRLLAFGGRWTWGSLSRKQSFRVYEIFPRDSNPTLMLIAKLQVAVKFDPFHGHRSDEFILHIDGRLIIWNFESKTTFEKDFNGAFRSIFATGNYICFVDAFAVVIWEVIRDDNEHKTPIDLVFHQHVPIPLVTPAQNLHRHIFRLSVTSSEEPDTPHYISIEYQTAGTRGSREFILNDVFRLWPQKLENGAAQYSIERVHPTVRIALKGNFNWSRSRGVNTCATGCFFRTIAMCTSRDKEHVRVLITDLRDHRLSASSNAVPDFVQHVRLLPASDVCQDSEGIVDYALCPFSGRLILLLRCRMRICVVDFVPKTWQHGKTVGKPISKVDYSSVKFLS